jgi:hypothetical protein
MMSSFTKVKLWQPCPLRAVDHPGFERFQPTGGQFDRGFSCRTQIGQPFQIPTDTPCQRAVFPVASGFVIRLCDVVAIKSGLKKALINRIL